MNIEQLREVITRCAALDPNDDFGMEKCWEEMTEILSDDISATIHFFEKASKASDIKEKLTDPPFFKFKKVLTISRSSGEAIDSNPF